MRCNAWPRKNVRITRRPRPKPLRERGASQGCTLFRDGSLRWHTRPIANIAALQIGERALAQQPILEGGWP